MYIGLLPRALLWLGILIVLKSNVVVADKAKKLSNMPTESTSINIHKPLVLPTNDTIGTHENMFPFKKVEYIQNANNLSKSKENKQRVKENKSGNKTFARNGTDMKFKGTENNKIVETKKSNNNTRHKINDTIAEDKGILKFKGNVTRVREKQADSSRNKTKETNIDITRPVKKQNNKNAEKNQIQNNVKTKKIDTLESITRISKSKGNVTKVSNEKNVGSKNKTQEMNNAKPKKKEDNSRPKKKENSPSTSKFETPVKQDNNGTCVGVTCFSGDHDIQGQKAKNWQGSENKTKKVDTEIAKPNKSKTHVKAHQNRTFTQEKNNSLSIVTAHSISKSKGNITLHLDHRSVNSSNKTHTGIAKRKKIDNHTNIEIDLVKTTTNSKFKGNGSLIQVENLGTTPKNTQETINKIIKTKKTGNYSNDNNFNKFALTQKKNDTVSISKSKVSDKQYVSSVNQVGKNISANAKPGKIKASTNKNKTTPIQKKSDTITNATWTLKTKANETRKNISANAKPGKIKASTNNNKTTPIQKKSDTITNATWTSKTKSNETRIKASKQISGNQTNKMNSSNSNSMKNTIPSKISSHENNVTTVKQRRFTVIPTVEESIIEEEFIMINDKKNRKPTSETKKAHDSVTAKTSKDEHTPLSASQNHALDHHVEKRSPLEFNQVEDIEVLDWTGPPTMESTTKSTTTVTNWECDSNDYSSKSSCNLTNYEMCNNHECQCIPGYNWKYKKGPCDAIVLFVIELTFDLKTALRTRLKRMASSRLTAAGGQFDCPPEVANYITSVMSSSDYAEFFYPGADYQESCYNVSGKMKVNFTMEFTQADMADKTGEDILKSFDNTTVPPPFPETELNVAESTAEETKVPCESCVDSKATCNATDGVCVCPKSYIDLSQVNSYGMMCSKCDPDCQNGGVCMKANTSPPTVVCQCSSSMYFGDSCGDSYVAIIAGSVVAGVLFIAAAISVSVIYYRNTKLKKIRKKMENQIAVDQYLENTNFRRHSIPVQRLYRIEDADL